MQCMSENSILGSAAGGDEQGRTGRHFGPYTFEYCLRSRYSGRLVLRHSHDGEEHTQEQKCEEHAVVAENTAKQLARGES